MTTHFLTLELDLLPFPGELQRLILAELRRYGEPLRWAVTQVDADRGKVQIEAVVTTATELLLPNTPIVSI
ncbi:MAG: hypothetical protein HC827_15420 [Cyanobacteria bacterium RM1_2_2]|nr:hypothetical protein [Cyanobacteria bacterium RM1_2_2]